MSVKKLTNCFFQISSSGSRGSTAASQPRFCRGRVDGAVVGYRRDPNEHLDNGSDRQSTPWDVLGLVLTGLVAFYS